MSESEKDQMSVRERFKNERERVRKKVKEKTRKGRY